MNAIEQLLSDTADMFEAGLTEPAREEAMVILQQNRQPNVTREIQQMPGYSVLIEVMPTPGL